MNATHPAVHHGPITSLALALAISIAATCGTAVAADPPAAKPADQVIVAASDDRGAPTKWTGQIIEYTGRGLRLHLADDHEKMFPAARVVSVSTPLSAQQQAGDTAFAQGNFRGALGQYRAALEGKNETREWVRRQILSQIVWCYQSLGEWESACDYFLILLERDRTTPYFDCVPLAWLPQEPSPSLARKAKDWLSKTDSPAARLLGASHLLSTAERPAALEVLTKLATERDQRVALLAEAQKWRTQAFQANDKQCAEWEQAAGKTPDPLRAGPDFIIGSALAPRHPKEAALWLMRPAVLYPRQRQLAAAGLAAAATALARIDRPDDAKALWGEIAMLYSDQAGPAKEAADQLGGGKIVTPRASADSGREPADQRFVAGLRRRQLFGLAEDFCRARLGDAELDDTIRAEMVIDLVRTLAEHALALPADSREPIWAEINTAIDDFQRGHPRNQRILLVRMQGALAALARAELARQETEVGVSAAGSIDSVRAQIRAAIVQLKQLDDDLAGEIRQRKRPGGVMAGTLSDAELSSLEANARYQLARAFRNQALSYPAESNDRINALTQAIELLTPLSKSAEDDPLAWPSRIEEIVCLRQVGKLAEATRRLGELQGENPPLGFQRRLRAESLRLLIAKGRLAEALTAAGPAIDDDDAGAAELDFARLEVLVALWQRAGGAAPPADEPTGGAEAESERPAADWQKQATAQVQHIEKVHGPYWMRRAETLLAESFSAGPIRRTPTAGTADVPRNLDGLIRAAASYFRAGQIDEALTTYDQAARAAAEAGLADKSFELRSTAAGIQSKRKQFRDAQRRFYELASEMPDDPRAAEMDLAAIFNQASAGAAEGKAQDKATLQEYRQLLEHHLATWPDSPTSGQAAWWLGRLCQHDGQLLEAIAAFRRVPPTNGQFAAAVEAAAQSYQRLLDQARAAGKPDEQTAREALDWLRQVVAESAGRPDDQGALGRQAILWAARITINDLPGGAPEAEDMLKQALADDAAAPADWQDAARLLLVWILTQRQRYDEAAAVLGKGVTGGPEELLNLLERLNQVSSRTKPEQRSTVIQLEQQTLIAIDAKKPRFDEAWQRRLQLARLRTLIDAGRNQPALVLAEKLAGKYPDDGSVQEDYARLLSRSTDQAQLRSALARWREIVERSRPGTPRWFRAQLGMAQSQLALGNRSQARTIVKIVETSYPDFSTPGGEKDAELRAAFLDVIAKAEKP